MKRYEVYFQLLAYFLLRFHLCIKNHFECQGKKVLGSQK